MPRKKFKSGDVVKTQDGKVYRVLESDGAVAHGSGPWINTYRLSRIKKNGSNDPRYKRFSEEETNINFA